MAGLTIDQLSTSSGLSIGDLIPVLKSGQTVATNVAFQILRSSDQFLTAASFVSGGDIIPIIQNGVQRATTASLLGSGLSQNVSAFIANFAAAQAGSMQARERLRVYVWDAMTEAQRADYLSGNATLDLTTPIQNVITYAKTFSGTQTEVAIIWPAGAASVTNLDYTNAKRVVNIAEGAVIIYGSSIGGASVINAYQGVAGAQAGLNFKGQFSVQLKPGATYQYGLRLDGCNNSYGFEMTASGAYSVAAIACSNSFDSSFFFTPTNTQSGSRTFMCEDGNLNRVFMSLRATGDSSTTSGSVGATFSGFASMLFSDINSCTHALDISGAFGCSFPIYTESVKNSIITGGPGGLARGNEFPFGNMEIGTNGFAFALGSGAGSEFTKIGKALRIKGVSGGSSRTAINFGTQAYEVTIDGPDMSQVSPQAVDTISTGTYQGAKGGLQSLRALPMNWLSYTPIQQASSDPNTNDDYAEGTWTPVLTNVTPGDLAVTYALQAGFYTKNGREVTVVFYVQTSAFTHTTSAGVYRLTGLPYTAANVSGSIATAALGQFSGVTKLNYTQFSAEIDNNTSLIAITASGSGQSLANVVAADLPSGGTVILAGEITYLAAT